MRKTITVSDDAAYIALICHKHEDGEKELLEFLREAVALMGDIVEKKDITERIQQRGWDFGYEDY